MTITVTISPQAQAELARQAAALGSGVEDYAASLLEQAAHIASSSDGMNQDRLENALRDMSQYSQKIPLLPEEAFTREGLYRDHD